MSKGIHYDVAFSNYSSYAEPTSGSCVNIAASLAVLIGRDLKQFSLFDAGCGYGRLALEIAENLRLVSLPLASITGMEIDDNLHPIAQVRSQVYTMDHRLTLE